MVPGPFGATMRSRLLPMSLPFRFFGAAVLFHIAAWAMLLAGAGELGQFSGGLGPLFAALHLSTLGVLAMTAMGATLQLLPVATRQPVRSLAAVKATWWLLVPGIAIFAGGAAAYAPRTMAGGAMLVTVALGLYAWLLAGNLYRARGMKAIVAHGWAALGCLVLLLGTGLALVARYEHGLALDYGAFRAAHFLMAAYGFMGLLAVGLSYLLLPMFAVSPTPPSRLAYVSLSLAVAGLTLAIAALFVHSGKLAAFGAVLGVGAASLHVFALERSLRGSFRRPLGTGFLLMRVGWVSLIASLVAGGAAALYPSEALGTLFVVLLVPGWLLTFLLGVLQRIVPFLGSVHASNPKRGTPRISELTPTPPLSAHAVLHGAALAGLIASSVTGQAWLAYAAASLGLAGALAYATFFIIVLARIHNHGIQPPHQPAPA